MRDLGDYAAVGLALAHHTTSRHGWSASRPASAHSVSAHSSCVAWRRTGSPSGDTMGQPQGQQTAQRGFLRRIAGQKFLGPARQHAAHVDRL